MAGMSERVFGDCEIRVMAHDVAVITSPRARQGNRG
jgi:hypothetical protein